jgi:hypothetical protein
VKVTAEAATTSKVVDVAMEAGKSHNLDTY